MDTKLLQALTEIMEINQAQPTHDAAAMFGDPGSVPALVFPPNAFGKRCSVQTFAKVLGVSYVFVHPFPARNQMSIRPEKVSQWVSTSTSDIKM